MTYYEFMCCNKVYNAVMGYIDRKSITKQEVKIALEVLKKMTDNRNDWTDECKTSYKALIEYAKHAIERK